MDKFLEREFNRPTCTRKLKVKQGGGGGVVERGHPNSLPYNETRPRVQ